MGLEIRENSLYAVCSVCGADYGIGDKIWEAVSEGETLRELEDWYIHIHSLEGSEELSIDPDDVYAFCPDDLPEEALPTAEKRPDFDIEGVVSEMKGDSQDLSD